VFRAALNLIHQMRLSLDDSKDDSNSCVSLTSGLRLTMLPQR